jgi:adenosylhomocysteine nucleosidase
MIIIITALQSEAKLLTNHTLKSPEQLLCCGNEVTYGQYADHKVLVATVGMGTVNAAAGAQALIDLSVLKFGETPQFVLFTGIAGSLDENVHIGDLVIAKSLSYCDTDVNMIAESKPFQTTFQSDTWLTNIAKVVCQKSNLTYHLGNIITGNRFVGTDQLKEVVRKDAEVITGFDAPLAVEMEGAAVAHVAAKNDLPFLVIRAVSDECNEDYSEFSNKQFDIEQYATHSARTAEAILRQFIEQRSDNGK